MRIEYHYMKSYYTMGAVVCAFVAVWALFVFFLKPQIWFFVYEVPLLLLLCWMTVRYILKAKRIHTKAVIDSIGIHIMKGCHEITVLNWEDVYACNCLPAGSNARPPYMVIVINPCALIDGSLAAQRVLPVSDKIARKYRLDEAMEELACNKLSTSQFRKRGVYLLGITKNQYSMVKPLWEQRVVKTRDGGVS